MRPCAGSGPRDPAHLLDGRLVSLLGRVGGARALGRLGGGALGGGGGRGRAIGRGGALQPLSSRMPDGKLNRDGLLRPSARASIEIEPVM